MPAPPESLVRLLMERQQERGPDVGPMTEEEMRLYLSDPAHKQAMNVSLLLFYFLSLSLYVELFIIFVCVYLQEFLAHVVKMASAKLPPGALLSGEESVDVKVHMLSVPMPLSMMPSPPPTPASEEPAKQSKVSASKLRFPGGLFFGREPARTHKSDKQVNTTRTATLEQSSSTEGVDKKTKPTQRPTAEETARVKEAVLGLLPEVTLQPPREHALRQLWDRLAEEETTKKVVKLNRRLLEKEYRRQGIQLRDLTSSSDAAVRDGGKPHSVVFYLLLLFNCILLYMCAVRKTVLHSSSLFNVLSRKVLTADEVAQAVHSSRLLQAGLGPTQSFVVGLWAADAGLCATLGLPIARLGTIYCTLYNILHNGRTLIYTLHICLGRMPSKPVDELFASITDKHERALLPNVISPADVGVSYDMIGGLRDVKQCLQQCITYPLKYPRLYQEGIASEGVKGVLLFGPPGKLS